MTGKLFLEEHSGPWAESSVWPWLGLRCAESWSVEDEYGSRSPAGTLCSSEEIHSRVTGSAPRAEVCSVLLLLYQDIEVCGCHGLGLCLS